MNTKLTIIALTTTLAGTALAQSPSYTVNNLGALNGQSEAFAINATGTAVGWSFTTMGTRQAVMFRNGQVIPLATPVTQNSIALGIDAAGRIVGKVNKTAAIWTSNVSYTSLGTLGGQESVASGINQNGLIAMSAQNGQAHWKAAQYQLPGASGTTALPMLGGLQGSAAACSNGNLVGWSDLANGQTHATLWANGNVLDYGTLGGPASQFLGVSEQGNPCGWSTLADHQFTPSNRGFIYRAVVNTASRTLRSLGEPYMARPYPTNFNGYRGFKWTYYDRGVLKTANVVGVDCQATGVNGNTVCGNAMLYLYPTGMMRRAVAWVNGTFYDLTNLTAASGWTLQNAWGVNKNNQIVGQGFAPNGQLTAYRLDPKGNGTGLAFARFAGWTAGQATPLYAETKSPATIPTVTLYVRKSDGMVATSMAGPFTSAALYSWNLTDPATAGKKVTLSIDERGNPVSPNGVANWNNVCNSLQAGYNSFSTGADGSLRVLWYGTNMNSVLNNFPNDTQLVSRWKFTTTGTQSLMIRLVIRKGPGY